MEQCAINVCLLIKLEKVQAEYFSKKMLRDLKVFLITILGSALDAMAIHYCVKTPSLR